MTCPQSVVALVSLFCFNIAHGCMLAVNCYFFLKSRHVRFVNKCVCWLRYGCLFFVHAEFLGERVEDSYYECVSGMLN